MRLVLFLVMLLAFSCPARALTVCSPSGFTEAGIPVDALLTGAGADARDVHARQESVEGNGDVLEAFNALFLARGWGDGLPGDLPIAVLAPMGGVATVENIAVNAVMAGCEPRHMPLLTAAVEAVSQPEFDLRGMATTTNPDAVLMIVSGPMVEKLGLNAGCGTFGRGSRGNAAVSRALHLIIQNVGGSRPGITDMSNLGQPGDFVMFLAENAGANPWPSYHTEMGFPEESNVVTVAAVEGYAGIMGIGYDGREYLELIAAWLRGHDRPYRSAVILVVAQDTAKMLEREGWTRENMRAYLREHARIPLREWRRLYHAEKERRRGVPREAFSLRDGNALVPKPFWDAMPIIVSGGAGEKSMLMPCWAAGRMVSREVRLPQERE